MSAIAAHFFPHDTVRRAAEIIGCDEADILGPRRDRLMTEVRFAIMAAMHRKGMTLPAIGRRLHRHHTTVLNGLRRAEYLRRDAAFVQMVEALG